MKVSNTGELLEWLQFEIADTREQMAVLLVSTGGQRNANYYEALGHRKAYENVMQYIADTRSTSERLYDLFTREPDAVNWPQRRLAKEIGVSVAAVNKAVRRMRTGVNNADS